jgi:hypothetical protein
MSDQTLQWSDLFTKGSIVDLDVRKWLAREKLSAVDLGIENTDDVKKAFSLGTHRLAPQEAFDGITRAVHMAQIAMAKYTMPFALIRGARFAANDRLPLLFNDLRIAKDAFIDAVNVFCSNYEIIKATMLPVLEAALKDAARTPEAAYIALMRLQSEYPTRDEVASKFELSWSVYTLASATASEAKEAVVDDCNKIKSVVRGMLESLRGEVSDKVINLINLASKGGKINKKSVNAAKEALDRAEDMNRMINDNVLRDQIGTLRALLDNTTSENNVASVIKSLETVKEALAIDVSAAIENAEKQLTGFGQRRFQ